MKFCQKCGKEIMDQAVVCPACGCAVQSSQVSVQSDKDDKANIGLIILSVLIPIVGVILWPVMNGKSPKAARVYGLTGIISWVVYFLLMIVIGGL